MALWQLQQAEYRLKFNVRHYYERAEQRGSLLLYSHEDAQAIIDFWRGCFPHADYMVLAAPDTIDMVKG
jgi:hypothetical protein